MVCPRQELNRVESLDSSLLLTITTRSPKSFHVAEPLWQPRLCCSCCCCRCCRCCCCCCRQRARKRKANNASKFSPSSSLSISRHRLALPTVWVRKTVLKKKAGELGLVQFKLLLAQRRWFRLGFLMTPCTSRTWEDASAWKWQGCIHTGREGGGREEKKGLSDLFRTSSS